MPPVTESTSAISRTSIRPAAAPQNLAHSATGSSGTTMSRERPDALEPAIARLADAHGCPPVPLDAFEPDRSAAAKLGERLVKLRGTIPFASLAGTSLVAVLNPGDEELRRAVADALGENVRFYLADPQHVEAAVAKLWPEEVEGA